MTAPSRDKIWKMFDAISPTYDRVNRVMTFGMDRYWRGKMSSHLPKGSRLALLDCATGTGDQIFSLMRSGRVATAVGIDLAEQMLNIGRRKAGSSATISFECASALAIPYPDSSFDCCTISFGIRNVTDTLLCLKEMHRVLKPKGRVLILETSLPQNRCLKTLNLLYLRHILPRLGGWISKEKSAYVYLNKTIESFPCGEPFLQLMREGGFAECNAYPLTWGAVTLYVGDKR